MNPESQPPIHTVHNPILTLYFTHAKSPLTHNRILMSSITRMISFTSNMPPNQTSNALNPSSPQSQFPPTRLLRLKPQPLPPIHPPTPLLPTAIQPLLQILTLAHIKTLQPRAPLHHSLDPDTRNSHTPADGKFLQFEEMQANAAERGVRDRGAAEGEFEGGELGAA